MSCDRPEPLKSENAAGWLQNIRMLADLQDQIIKCRRFASETSNPEQSRRLYQIANDIEQRARELDREYCSGRRGRMVQGGRQETGAALVAALEKAGVEFIAENGGGAGVRMKKRAARGA